MGKKCIANLSSVKTLNAAYNSSMDEENMLCCSWIKFNCAKPLQDSTFGGKRGLGN